HLLTIALGPLLQVLLVPPPSLEFLHHNPLRLGQSRFPPFFPVMLGSQLRTHGLHQFLAKRLIAQTPAPSDPFPLCGFPLPPPPFHPPLKFLSTGRAVGANAHLSEDPVHTQPPQS